MRRIMFLMALLFVGMGAAIAQVRSVQGTVLSGEDDMPIIGATVLVVGTSQGSITDIDGHFAINNIPANATTIRVSYVGMIPKEVAIAENMKVILQANTQQLDEVTVVAYGTAKKNSLTGAYSAVKGDDIAEAPVTSFEKALQGQAAGVQIQSTSGQPGAATTVRIRGIGSISASSSPLYVIDGVAVAAGDFSKLNESSTNPLSSLNPADIESVSILKDASAASLYGSRAANGVILITTKKGSEGKAKVNFKSQWSWSTLPSQGYDLMNASEHYKLYYQGFYNAGVAAGEADPSAYANSKTQGIYQGNPYNVANPLTGANGQVTEGAKLRYDADWLDSFYDTAMAQQYDLSVSGGNKDIKYFMSMGYLDQDGIAKGSDYERYSGRANISSKVNEWMSMGINSTYSLSKQNSAVGGTGGSSGLYQAMNVPNTVPIYVYEADGSIARDAKGQKVYNYENPIFNDMNGIAFAEQDEYFTETTRAIINPYIDLNIYGVKWHTSMSYDYLNLNETQWYNTEHGNGASADGRLKRFATWNKNYSLTSTLNYLFSVKEDHHFNLLAGYEVNKTVYEFIESEGIGFPGGMKSLTSAATPDDVNGTKDRERMISYLGRINYDYMNRYFASFSMRTDGSSRFAPGHRWGNFWSLGLNWRLSEEAFMEDIAWINDMKVRASYGTSGNKSGSGYYGYYGLYDIAAYNGSLATYHSQFSNDELTWEKAKNLNIGVDFSLFNNRLSGSIEYYHKQSDDLLLNRPIAGSAGLDSILKNVGEMENQGVELSLTSTNLETADFSWSTNFNASYNQNEITGYPQEMEVSGSKVRQEGYSIYEFYIPKWAGVDPNNGDPLWYYNDTDANGKTVQKTTNNYSKADKYHVGDALPVVYGAVTNSFSYKNFDFSFMLSYSFGGKVYDYAEASLMNDGNDSPHQAITNQFDSWTPENPTASNPIFVPNNQNNSNSRSTRFLHDADFIKLKNINVSYNLPKELVQKAQLGGVRVYASVENIYTWNLDHDFEGYDVELGGISGTTSAGTVPLPRTVLVGVNVNF